MSGELIINVLGNITADPELRYTQNGVPVANFTIAQTPRVFDRATNDWKDGDTVFLRSSVWREAAEHVAGSLRKGQRVIASGQLKQSTYQDKNTGENRTSYDLDVHEIGPSLRYGTAVFTKSTTGAQNAPANAAPAQAAPAAPAGQTAPAVAPAAPAAPAAAPAAQVPEVQF